MHTSSVGQNTIFRGKRGAGSFLDCQEKETAASPSVAMCKLVLLFVTVSSEKYGAQRMRTLDTGQARVQNPLYFPHAL